LISQDWMPAGAGAPEGARIVVLRCAAVNRFRGD
jgi:hypothetical protein